MIFVISHYRDADVLDMNKRVLWPGIDVWSWSLHRSSRRQPTEAICRSSQHFDSEKEARSDVARMRLVLRASARYAKVVVQEDVPDDVQEPTDAA